MATRHPAQRAWHADALADGREVSWDEIAAMTRPASASRITPDPARQAVYRGLLPVYERCEARALADRAAGTGYGRTS